MKNLKPLNRHIFYWDAIVGAKRLAARTRLVGLRATVLTRMQLYRRLCNPLALETIPASTYAGADKTALLGCYSDSKSLAALKVKIREAQPRVLRGECQYCNMSEPNTYDHYLPKEDFSEFSSFSQNLVPCCPQCNNKKSTVWLSNGHRSFIHFYFDDLPTVTYLECAIVYRKGVPIVTYQINAALIPAGMRDVIISHYDKLHLLERYKERSDSEISDVISSISNPQAQRLSRAEIISQLLEEAAAMKVAKGPNYWRAICKEALANTPQFLNAAGY